MTKEEKTHKLKLIMLIIICESETLRRDPPKTIQDSITKAIEINYWLIQLYRMSQPLPKYETGCLTHKN